MRPDFGVSLLELLIMILEASSTLIYDAYGAGITYTHIVQANRLMFLYNEFIRQHIQR